MKEAISIEKKETENIIQEWSIGIYKGDSPFNLKPINGIEYPMVSQYDVTDINARFVADPFMIKKDGLYYMFYEVLNDDNDLGEIGLSTSKDGVKWNYEKIVLKEAYHLSYPFIFKWENEYYMCPETLVADYARLYKAKNFPFEWNHVANLVSGKHPDPTLIRHDDKWWLFSSSPENRSNMDTLRLYYSNDLTGPYTEHPMSPLIQENKRIARPAGRMIQLNSKWIRFCQDCYPSYGNSVRAFEINKLSTTEYSEKEMIESPVLQAAKGSVWNGGGMHQIDPFQTEDGKWMACVDGHFTFEKKDGL